MHPLFPHAAGQWARKIRGRFVYFGPWAEPQGALERYLRQKDDLLAGRKPRPVDQSDDGVTVAHACNHFLSAKKDRVNVGELQQRTWDEYHRVCQRIVRVFGRNRCVSDLRPDDFAELHKDIAKTNGPVRLRNEIKTARSVFKWAYEAQLIDRPVPYGPGFTVPSAKTLRVNRTRHEKRLFTRDQLHRLMNAASVPMRGFAPITKSYPIHPTIDTPVGIKLYRMSENLRFRKNAARYTHGVIG